MTSERSRWLRRCLVVAIAVALPLFGLTSTVAAAEFGASETTTPTTDEPVEEAPEDEEEAPEDEEDPGPPPEPADVPIIVWIGAAALVGIAIGWGIRAASSD